VEHDEQRSETILADPALNPPTPAAAPTPTERDAGVAAERERVDGIRQACLAGRVGRSFEDKLIKDGIPLVEAQRRVFAEIAARGAENVPRPGPGGQVEIRVGDDPFVHVRKGIENALLHRAYPKQPGGKGGFELTDEGKVYRGMTLLRIAEAYLAQRGIRTTGMSKMELAGFALGLSERAGLHTTSDFALLLADVAGKTLRRAYDEAPQTFTSISRRITFADFKPVKKLQIGEAPQLVEIDEHGEYTRGTIGEGREQFQLATYGRIFGITRKALVNDDTDAFSRVATLFGRAARNLESNLVWAQITANGLMGDGTALFATGHGNLAGTPSVIDIANIGLGRTAMRKQTGLDAATLLNINPLFLIVPAELETVADQFVSVNIAPSAAGSVNPFAGRLSVIAEPRLGAADANAWFLAASPDQIDIIEYGSLEGEEGPMVESRLGFDVDGLEIKARHDFAAKVIDWRGLYKNAGA